MLQKKHHQNTLKTTMQNPSSANRCMYAHIRSHILTDAAPGTTALFDLRLPKPF
uniref:Uncharacterized protein n=1 Tax=Anopheles christyi TaxID=43041 RepID=A0A182KHU7_9DIPT